jgi:hypothetical protein
MQNLPVDCRDGNIPQEGESKSLFLTRKGTATIPESWIN